MISCEAFNARLKLWRTCRETDQGLIVSTDCLYPSFDQVEVKIYQVGEVIFVSDQGGAVASVISQGKTGENLGKSLEQASKRYGVSTKNYEIIGECGAVEWLPATILSVANASSFAAQNAFAAEEESEKKQILHLIESELDRLERNIFPLKRDFMVKRNVEAFGLSGKKWKVDFAIMTEKPIFLKTVSSHHVSINSAYVAFSDIHRLSFSKNISVHSRELKEDDVALLNEVSNVVSVENLYSRISADARFLG